MKSADSTKRIIAMMTGKKPVKRFTKPDCLDCEEAICDECEGGKGKMGVMVFAKGARGFDFIERPEADSLAVVFPNGERIEMRYYEKEGAVEIRCNSPLRIDPAVSNSIFVRPRKS